MFCIVLHQVCIYNFPFSTVVRVWDIFLAEGVLTLDSQDLMLSQGLITLIGRLSMLNISHWVI